MSNGDLKNVSRAMALAPTEFNQRRDRGANAGVDRAGLLVVSLLKLAQPVDVIYRIK